MSVGQEHDSGADDPDLIRLNKRSLFTPSASVAVEQHSAVPHVSRSTYGTAKVEGRLTSPNARVPEIITQRCGGITVKGHTLKSFAYTTDAVIIRNTNANAILAVYPFTGEPVITQALLTVAQMPLFVGVGGGTTTGPRVAELAMWRRCRARPAWSSTLRHRRKPSKRPCRWWTSLSSPRSRRMMKSPNARFLPVRPSSMWQPVQEPRKSWQASARIIRKSRFWLRAEVVKTVFSPPLMRAPTRSHGRRQARNNCSRR